MYESIHSHEKDYLLSESMYPFHAYILSSNCPLKLRAQCVDTCHSLFEAVQEVFRQTVPVARQTLPVLKDGLHAEP